MRNFNRPWSLSRVLHMVMAGAMVVTIAGCNQATDNNQAGNPDAGPAPAAVTEPSTPAPAFVRAVHTVRGAGPVTVTVGDAEIVDDLTFGEASDFIAVQGPKVKIHSTTEHQFQVVDGDGKVLGGPLSLDLERGEDVTVVIGGTPGKITLTPFEHTNRGSELEQAKVAVLHADPALPEIAVTVDGKSWPGDIGYGQVTGYQDLSPGAHTMKVMYDKSLVGIVDIDRKPGVSPPPPVTVSGRSVVSLTQALDLEANKVYSVIVYSDANGLPKLRFLEDKFVPTLVRADDVTPTTDATDTTATATDVTSQDPLTDLVVIVAEPIKPELIGRRVQLSNVSVQSVVGDEVFWVGPDASQRLLVSWDEEKGTEARTDVNPGQKVTVTGVLRKAPSTTEAQQQWGLTAAEAGPFEDEPFYLQTDRVQITSQ